jgi:2-iminobutanoate/2-iminopropanoate deaminase
VIPIPELAAATFAQDTAMSRTAIAASKAPAAIGPYSQGIAAGSLIFTSGQGPLDPVTGLIPAGPAAQARQCMENVKAVLEAGGSGMEEVVKMTVFLQNLDHFSVVNEVYASFFSGEFPARSCVQAARLPMDTLVEIEAVAVRAIREGR